MSNTSSDEGATTNDKLWSDAANLAIGRYAGADPAADPTHPLHQIYAALRLYHRRSPLFEEFAADLAMLAGALAISKAAPSILDARALKVGLGRAFTTNVRIEVSGALASWLSRASLLAIILGVGTSNSSRTSDLYADLAVLDGQRKPGELEFATLFSPVPTNIVYKPTIDDLARCFMVARLERGVRRDMATMMATTIQDYLREWADRNNAKVDDIVIGAAGMPHLTDILNLRPPVKPNLHMIKLIKASKSIATTANAWNTVTNMWPHFIQGFTIVIASGWSARNRWLATGGAAILPEALRPSTDLYGTEYWDMLHFVSWCKKGLHLGRVIIDAVDDMLGDLQTFLSLHPAPSADEWEAKVAAVVDKVYAPRLPQLIAQGHSIRLNPFYDGYGKDVLLAVDPHYLDHRKLIIGG